MATSTLRIGALVWDNDYKHPVVFAKEMATLDVLSDGRLDLGIGAGWMITGYEQSGIPYESAGTRIDKMIEGIDIMKGCFAQGPFSYAGKHYTITNYNGLPKPVQGSCPPILINWRRGTRTHLCRKGRRHCWHQCHHERWRRWA